MTTANQLTDMEFDEISLVTRPANQLSKVVLFKSDTDSGDEMAGVTDDELLEEELEDEEEEEMEKGANKLSQYMEDDEEEEDEDMEKSDSSIDLPTEVYEYIEALENSNEALQAQINKIADDLAEEEQDIMKSASPEIQELVKSFEERASRAEEIAKAERDYRLEQEFIAKAETLSHLPVNAEEFGLALKKVAESVDAETFEAISSVLDGANEAVGNGTLFSEVGQSVSKVDGPMDEVSKAAAALRQTHPALTQEQAIAKAVEENPSLYDSYRRGE